MSGGLSVDLEPGGQEVVSARDEVLKAEVPEVRWAVCANSEALT